MNIAFQNGGPIFLLFLTSINLKVERMSAQNIFSLYTAISNIKI